MSKSLIAAVLVLAAALTTPAKKSSSSSSSSGDFALGIHLGVAQNGSSFSGVNFRLGQDESFDVVGAWNTKDDGTFIINGNYLHHIGAVGHIPSVKVVPYVGVGVGIWTANETGSWVQVPLGVDFRFSVPLEVGMYIAPGIDLIPETHANIHGGIAFRYWL